MNNDTDTAESLLPAIEPAPELPVDTPEEADDTPSLWDRCFHSDVPFIKLMLLDQLLRRPYHAVTLEGPLNVKQLAEDHRDRTFRSETSIDRCGNPKLDCLLLRLEGGVFGYLEGDSFKIYAPTPEAAQAAARQFRCYVKPQAAGKPCFFVISIEDHGPNTETVPIERLAAVTTEELALNYGTDFPAWEQQWTERMRRTPSGLTIFHGPPGCGKTSYLRALMARLIDKAVFYFIPVSEAEMLSNPRFVNFWIKQTKRHQKKTKIVLLEDAEELLLPRNSGNRDKVSTLLNLADGFLGDHLKLHVIATTNAPVRELDPALLRPGRLVGARAFRRLTRLEAQRLADAKGLALPDQEDFSVAELYCGAVSSPALSAGRQIGFAP
jgi:hypothetical protein